MQLGFVSAIVPDLSLEQVFDVAPRVVVEVLLRRRHQDPEGGALRLRRRMGFEQAGPGGPAARADQGHARRGCSFGTKLDSCGRLSRGFG